MTPCSLAPYRKKKERERESYLRRCKSRISLHLTMVKLFQSALTNGSCDVCMTWTLGAGDTWGLEYQEQEEEDAGHTVARQLIPVGQWSPREGLKMLDYLFPHIGHGFAGRNLPILSFNVS